MGRVKVERSGKEDMLLRKEEGTCNSMISSGIMQNIRRSRNLNILWSMLLAYVTILSSLCLTGAGANLSVIWCLDSSEEQLLNLSCGSASLIRINSVTHGWRNAGQTATADPTGSGGCLLPMQDICAEKYPNIRLLLDTCSGLSSCVVSSLEMSAQMSSCSARRSNYVFVTYECLIVGNETAIVNICDNPLKPRGALRTVYITSPNYPKNYDANTKCSCLVSTSSSSSSSQDGDQQQQQQGDGSDGSGVRSTEVVLQLIDFDVSLAPNELSPFDWIQYGRSEGRNWGDGRLIGIGGTGGGRSSLVTADQIFTGSDRVDVDFNTDEQREGRGFWIKVIGLNITSKDQVPVKIECGLYTPPDSRQALSCFEPPRSGELYLSCTAYGVINVLSIRSGYRPPTVNQTKVCTAEDVVKHANCISEVNIAVIEDQCMRRTTCNPPAPSNVNISAACGGGHSSDFVLVDYQCIPDSSQSGNIVNVCGDDMTPGTTLVRPSGSGFISSPLYPSNYPPDSNCFCRLEVTSSTLQVAGMVGQLVFYVLDLQLNRATDGELGNRVCSSMTSGCSNNDWLQYGSAGQIPGTGRNLSMEEKGKPIYTGSNVVVIAFHSDSQIEDRGFWIKYVGRSVDGTNAPVIVQCGRFAPQLDPGGSTGGGGGGGNGTSSPTVTNGEEGVNQSPDKTDNNSKTGLIVGVTVSVIIVILALLALIAFCVYRRRKRMKSGKILDESRTNSWSSRTHGMPGFSSSSSASDDGGSSEKKEKLFSGWKRGNNKTRPIDKKPHSPPFAIFYNEAYKMQDPTLYRNSLHSSVTRKKRISPAEETIHF